MKKSLILVIIYFASINLNAQDTHHSGKVTEAQLKFFKENYNWNSEKILIINFLQPKFNCHYDAYRNIKVPNSWWLNFYKDVDLKNIANRYVYSDFKAVKRIVDSETYFVDKEQFILKYFFSKEPYCCGILMINQTGNFEQKSSEYSNEEVIEYINRLSN